MSHAGSTLTGRRETFVSGYEKDHGRLPGRKGVYDMGQALIGREDRGGKLLLPKIKYLS